MEIQYMTMKQRVSHQGESCSESYDSHAALWDWAFERRARYEKPEHEIT
jgi:hypothetical protein